MKAGNMRGPASTSTTRESRVSIWRKSPRRFSCASSAMVPASSTPVGPPPMMTKVSSAWRSSGSLVRSARSKASSSRRRTVVASSSVFRPGREGLPLVMAEIGVARAGGEHQRVIGHRIAAIEQHAVPGDIDAGRRWRAGSRRPAGCAAGCGSARRSRRWRARWSPPDRAAAGTDDGCGGRSA